MEDEAVNQDTIDDMNRLREHQKRLAAFHLRCVEIVEELAKVVITSGNESVQSLVELLDVLSIDARAAIRERDGE